MEYLSDDEEARRIAELVEKGIRDEEAALAGARNAGRAEGRATGLAEGEKNNKI